MSDRSLVRVARSVAAVGAVLAAGSLVLAIATGEVMFWWRSFAALGAMVALAFAVMVWLIVPRQPRNRTVWAMSASVGSAINAMALALVPVLTDGDPFDVIGQDWVPADAPAAVGWVMGVGAAASVPGLFVPLTLGLMVFPEGRLPSSRWRPLAAVTVVAMVLLAITHGWWHRPMNDSRDDNPLTILSGVVCVLVSLIAVAGLIARFRRSSGTSRLQYKWIVCGTGIGALVFGGFFFLPDGAYDEPEAALVGTVGALCWVVSYGVAVGRYRLYDIDVVISRAVVYVSLAVLITGIYVIVVVVVGDRVGGSSVWLSVLATALVALAFEPARSRFQLWANRLVYGRRATPYEILGDLTRRLAAVESGEALLARLAEQLRAGTGAQHVGVWLDDAGTLRQVAAAPPGADSPEPADAGSGVPVLDVPIEHDGDVIGHLTVEEHPGMSLRPGDMRLARDLAGSAALVVRKLRLDRDLTATAAEIAESRRRLLGAQDDELRRLERELNNGIEQQVVALKVQLGLAGRTAADEGSDRASVLLAGLGADAQDAIDQIRLLAQGIYPPLLDADGLNAAVPLLAARSPLEVHVDVDVGRHPAATEGAVYFCIAEALTNASKHARGPVSIRVSDDDGALRFSVSDSGPGFDVERTAPGSGLHNLRDRLDALGGVLQVTSQPGSRTKITGGLPVDTRAGAAAVVAGAAV